MKEKTQNICPNFPSIMTKEKPRKKAKSASPKKKVKRTPLPMKKKSIIKKVTEFKKAMEIPLNWKAKPHLIIKVFSIILRKIEIIFALGQKLPSTVQNGQIKMSKNSNNNESSFIFKVRGKKN